MPPKRGGGGPGRPPDNDEVAVQWVQQYVLEHHRIGCREAARLYFTKYPKKRKAARKGKGLVQIASEARRVGDKAGARNRGIPTQSEWRQLLALQRHLLFGLDLVNDLLRRWKKRPKVDDASRGPGTDQGEK